MAPREALQDVGRACQAHLDVAQSNRLINSILGRFRWRITAALLTRALLRTSSLGVEFATSAPMSERCRSMTERREGATSC